MQGIKISLWSLPLASVPLVLMVACSQEKSQAPVAPTASNQTAEEGAAQAISSARCKRAERCGSIGEAKDFRNMDHCMDASRQESMDLIGQCSHGVDVGDVQQCVGEINNQDCGLSTEALSTWVACQTDDLCLD